ncbi:MAG TPA: hypothetical protein DCR81_02060 [Smithella sp.]|nr:hypothetical protein [Smithella sp.]
MGTCLTGLLTMPLRYSGKLRKKLNVPKDKLIYASLVMGYPAYRFTNTVSRKNRRYNGYEEKNFINRCFDCGGFSPILVHNQQDAHEYKDS